MDTNRRERDYSFALKQAESLVGAAIDGVTSGDLIALKDLKVLRYLDFRVVT